LHVFGDSAWGNVKPENISDYLKFLTGVCAILCHNYTCWLKFKGGKGVATYIGLLLGLCWPAALIFCVIWLVMAAVTRYSSAAALTASAVTPLTVWYFGQPKVALLFLLLTILAWLMHRANIARLLDGTEGKIGAKATVN